MLNEAGEGGVIGVQCKDASDEVLGNYISSNIANIGSFEEKAVTFTVPANTAYLLVYIWYNGGVPSVFVDDFSIAANPTIPPGKAKDNKTLAQKDVLQTAMAQKDFSLKLFNSPIYNISPGPLDTTAIVDCNGNEPVNTTRGERSLILFDIHNQVPTPAYLLENKAFLETIPFDGICVYFAAASDVMTNIPISYSSFYNALQPLQGQNFSNLKNNFVFVFGNRPADLFDDWSVAIQNFANLSKALKAVGLKGIFFDNEAYPPDTKSWGANYPDDVAYASTYSLQEYRTQARLRGKQMMQAMTSEFPEIEVITAHGPYLSEPSAPSPQFPGWQTANELIEPLFVGFMEGLNTTAKNIDGGELYTLRTANDFQKTYDWRKTTIASNSVNSSSIPAEDRLVWEQNANISYGIYDVPFGGAAMNPSIMQTTVTNSLNRCDQYVWFFAEQISFLLPASSGGASASWVNAVINGRLAAQNMDCTGFKATPFINNESCSGCNDGSVSLQVTGGTSPFIYSWSNGSTSKNITDLSSGTYSVIVTDLNNCITTSTTDILVTGLNDQFEKESIEINHIPVMQEIVVTAFLFNNEKMVMEILSAQGRIMAKKNIELKSGYQQESFALPSDIASGVYIIRICSNDGGVVAKKIVVTR
jgi:hypothetical protein